VEKSYLEAFGAKRILVVEADYFLTDETRRQLQHFGATIVSSSDHPARVLELIDHEVFDAAILNIGLSNEFILPVTEKLEGRTIPFIFAAGEAASSAAAPFPGFVLAEEPFELENIARALFGPSDS
jgi:hypothetical protein